MRNVFLDNSEYDGIRVKTDDRYYYYSPKWEMIAEGLKGCAI